MDSSYFLPPKKISVSALLPAWSVLVEYPLPAWAIFTGRTCAGTLATVSLPLEMLSSTVGPFPFHLILTGRKLLATDSNGLVDLQRALVGIAGDGAGCEQQRKRQQARAELCLFHKSLFSFCPRLAEANQDPSFPRRKA